VARRRGPTRRRLIFTPALLVALLIGFFAVWLEHSNWLPEPAAELVRQAETQVLVPILKELGFNLPSREVPSVIPDESLDLDQARTLLAGIRIEPEMNENYEREAWPHWLDLDGNCLNAREEVLVAESLDPAVLSRDGCRVLKGRWLDAYTGETLTDHATIDIDHVIALEEAHGSGGHGWNRERRAAFANDLSEGRSLIAVSAAANRAKGAQGPEEWLPPQAGYRCRYVVDWIAIKARWELSMDERERVSVGNILEACVAAGSTTSSVNPRPVR
jgi:hypothetical protein